MIELIQKQSTIGSISNYTEKKLSFVHCAEFYIKIKEEEGSASSTIKNYLIVFRKIYDFLVRYNKANDISLITELDLRTYFMEVKNRYKDTVYNVHMTIIKDLFESMYERGVLTLNPARFLKRLKVQKEHIKEILSEREIKLLIGSFQISRPAELRNLLIIMIFLDTGMRVNELVSLDIENFNFKERRIKFYAKKVKRHVEAFLTAPTIRVIDAYKNVVLKKRTTGPFFVAMDNMNYARPTTSRISIGFVSTMLKTKGEEINVHINPHKFRHTFATNYIRNGGDQFSLKELLGHNSITSTDVYVNLARTDLQKKHNNFNILNNLGGLRNE